MADDTAPHPEFAIDDAAAVAGRQFAEEFGVDGLTLNHVVFRLTERGMGPHHVVELHDWRTGTRIAVLTQDGPWWRVVAEGTSAMATKMCRTFPAAVAAARMAADLCNTPLPDVSAGRERAVTLDDLVELCPGYERVLLQEFLDVVAASGGAVTLTWTDASR